MKPITSREDKKEFKNKPINVNHSLNQPLKLVFNINSRGSKNVNSYKCNNTFLKNNKQISSKVYQSKLPPGQSQTQLDVIEALSCVYKDYQQHHRKWTIQFKETVLNDSNYLFDAFIPLVKSLNEKSSELLQQEAFWIMLIDYYIKTNKSKESILATIVSLFDEAFNYINEVKQIAQFYYDKISSISTGLKKGEMLNLLNTNSKYLLRQGTNISKVKKKKKVIEGYSTQPLSTYREELEYITIKKETAVNDQVNQDTYSSTLCNASPSIDTNKNQQIYNQTTSPIKIIDEEEDNEIIPLYEQRKLMKVAEIMKEVEDNYNMPKDIESMDKVHDSFLYQTINKKNQITPNKSSFSSEEKYPIDLVEGSIQKFNQSFTKTNI